MAQQKKDLQFLLSLIETGQITSWSQLLEREILIKAIRAFRGKGCASGSYEQEIWKLHRRCTNPNSVENFYLTAKLGPRPLKSRKSQPLKPSPAKNTADVIDLTEDVIDLTEDVIDLTEDVTFNSASGMTDPSGFCLQPQLKRPAFLAEPLAAKKKKNHGDFLGISNPSSLCYRNAVFQAISSVLDFGAELHSSASGPITTHLSRALAARLAGSHQELHKELEGLRSAFGRGKNSCFYSIRQQQCAEEFLSALLDAMEQQEDCRAVGLQFGGRLEERCSCSCCGAVYYHDCQLPRIHLVTSAAGCCIEQMVENWLNQRDMRSCEQCLVRGLVTVTRVMKNAPRKLVLAVVRYDNRNIKIEHTVHIKEELRIGTYPEGKRSLSEPPTMTRFLLQALVDHKGRSIGSGHYTATVLRPAQGAWLTYDDSQVTPTSASKMKVDSGKNCSLLFYSLDGADVNSTDECAQQTEKQPPMPNKALIRNSFKCYNQFDLEAVVRKPVIKDESCGLSGQIIQSETLTEQLKDLLDKNWTKDCTRKCNVKAEGQTALETEVEAHIKSRGVCSSLCDIVQRLLDIKYPQPPLAQGQDLPQPKVFGLLLGVTDRLILDSIRKSLAENKVQLVTVQNALDTCISACALRAEAPGLPMKSETRETNMITAASLGKEALEMLQLQQPISDWLTTAMVIEHLKQVVVEGVHGWVLVDFPSTFDQCRIFEASITGQWVLNPLFPEEKQEVKVESRIARMLEPVGMNQPFSTVFSSIVTILPEESLQCVQLIDVYSRQHKLTKYDCTNVPTEDVSNMTELLLLSSSSNPPASLRRRVFKSELPEFDISRDSALDLAELWEAVETLYVSRLENITLAARTQASLTTRCLLITKKQFSRFLGRENTMQTSVDAFIKVYNRAPRPWDVNSTDDLTSQVEHLTEKMKEEVETRRCEEEEEIKEAVVQPWLMKHFLETARNVSYITQLEMDRFVNTTGLLQDYMALSLREDRQPKHWRFEPPVEICNEIAQEWSVTLASLLLAEELPDQYLPDSFVAYCQSMLKANTAYVNELVMIICCEIEKTENKLKLKNEKKPIMTKNHSTVEDTFSLIDMKQKCLAAQQLQLLQEWRIIVIKEAELTLAAVETEWFKLKCQSTEYIEHLQSNIFHKMRMAVDVKQSTDFQSALDIKEFLLSAVKAAAPLSTSITIPLKIDYKRYLTAPAITQFSGGLRELMTVLKSISPDGRIPLDDLVDLLCQSTAAGRNLPPQWMLVEKKQIRQVLLGHLNGTGVVDWRALMVGLLDVPVASQHQLVTAATRLQEGTFCETHVWLDYAFEDPDEALDAKQFLLDAYTPSEQQPIAALEMLSACAHDPDPLAAFFKACALHQGQLLQEKRERLGQVARTNKVQLEAAVHACQAVTPTEDHSVAPRLQQIWNEAEELALDEEQRRSRSRASAAGTYVAINASSAAVEILRDHDPLIQLAHEYFGKQPLSDLLSSVKI